MTERSLGEALSDGEEEEERRAEDNKLAHTVFVSWMFSWGLGIFLPGTMRKIKFPKTNSRRGNLRTKRVQQQ